MAGRNYDVKIRFVGTDGASSIIGRIGKALSGIGKIAAGILGANLFMKLGQGLKNLGRDAFQSVAQYEQLGFTLETLMAREISRGQVVERTTREFVQATTSQKSALLDLQSLQNQQQKELSGLTESYEQAVRVKGEDSIAALTLKDDIGQLTNKMQENSTQLNLLDQINRGYITTTSTVMTNTRSIADAYGLAAEPAKELMKWTERLAIFSPFGLKQVAETLRTGMAYGFTTDQAKRLTEATVNYTAAAGLQGDIAIRISRALGQVQAKGRLMGEEIRQLTDASIPVVQILAEAFGKTESEITKMVRSGLIPANDAVIAIIENMEQFDGVAERQFETWAGLANAMGDIKSLGLQRLFSGVFEPFRPFIADFIRMMSDGGLQKLEEVGANIGENVSGAIKKVEKLNLLFDVLGSGKDFHAGRIMDQLGFSQEAQDNIFKLRDFFLVNLPEFKTKANEVGDALKTGFNNAIRDLGEILNEHGETISAALLGIGAALLIIQGTALVSGIISGITLAIAGLGAALASPVLIIGALVGLLVFFFFRFREEFSLFGSILLQLFTIIGLLFANLWRILGEGITSIKEVFIQIGLIATLIGVKIGNWIRDTVTKIGIWIDVLRVKIAVAWLLLRIRTRVAFTKLKTTIREKFDEIVLIIVQKIDEWTTAGKNLLQGFLDGMKSKADQIIAWITKLAKDILDKITNVFDFGSPSKETFKMGVNIVKGLIDGMNSLQTPALNVSQNLGLGLLGGLSGRITPPVASSNSSNSSVINYNQFDFKDTELTEEKLVEVLDQISIREGEFK